MTHVASLVLPPEPRYLGPSVKYTSSYACRSCGETMTDTHTAKVGLSHTEIRSEAKLHVETTGHTVQVELRGPAGLDEFRLATCGAAHCKLAGEVLSAAGEGVCHHHAEFCDSDHAPAKLDAEGACRVCDPISGDVPQGAVSGASEPAAPQARPKGGFDPRSVTTSHYASLPADDPRRFSFAPEPDEANDPNRTAFGFGREYGNDRIRSHRGPRVAAGRRS